ncbi:MAG: hypothetical protein DRH15_05350 [Deltaproteobacteria bacterium]|nr:MAG: hypothetical protein DRH15_05350 [Deltaproteobacteria bacterium]
MVFSSRKVVWGEINEVKAVGKPVGGSVLIVVLWILALLAYLTGDYLSFNRERSAICSSSWDAERQNQAINSIIELFSMDVSPLTGQEEMREWIDLSPGGVKVWVKVEKEGNRVNLNTAPDPDIREKILELIADKDDEMADRLASAILDWRDPDSLTRSNGAERGYYQDHGFPYEPANGPFESLTELLLVRDMTPELFWGDPFAAIKAQNELGDQEEMKSIAVSDAFTIFEAGVKRISMIIPGKGNSYHLVIAFLKRVGSQWRVFQIYRTMLISATTEEESED